jgi:hypothetical protein
VAAQGVEERVIGVVDVAAGERHRVGVGECGALARVEGAFVRDITDDGFQLLLRDASLAADGSVDVLSEDAAVVRGDATIDEGLELRIDQSELAERAPHSTNASEERRKPGVNEMVEERGAPFLGLGVEDAGDLGRD